ncbi:MAG: hypothetical protein HY892_02855 [Deltaproteobacteria bacterium]|nr:hypothetical protein [Deltaproteobacteria bacterium]
MKKSLIPALATVLFVALLLNPALPVQGAALKAYLPFTIRELDHWARNDSTGTTCAEEDNVNTPVFAQRITRFSLTATHPLYDVGVDNCNFDFSGCTGAAAQEKGVLQADVCTGLYDDGINVIKGCVVPGWWRPFSMRITVGSTGGDFHYLQFYRKIQDANSWPQFLVLYEDGNLRLKPHPPAGRNDVCFGSSVIIGPATPAARPFVDIQEVTVNPSAMTLDLTFRSGGTAHVSLSVDRTRAVASIDVNYPADKNKPFAIFRSMNVTDGNADVDHIQSLSGIFPILSGWTTLQGPWWFFHRAVRSIHNTSAPDIRIEITE